MGVTPKISVVVACHGKCPELDGLMCCLSQQKEYAKRDKVYRPIGPSPYQMEIVLSSDGPYEANMGHLDRDDVRLVTNVKEGGVGHSTRGPGIAAATGDWIVLTNADNLYAHGWLCRIVPEMQAGVGLVSWGVSNSIWKYSSTYKVEMKRASIDMGCVAVKSEIAKRVGFPYRNYDGDWDYIEACWDWCKKTGQRHVHIPETLFIHN